MSKKALLTALIAGLVVLVGAPSAQASPVVP